MNIPIGTYIKVIFKNGTLVEGIVDVIEEDEIILLSEDRCNVIVITSPEDIMAYKFAVEPQQISVEPKRTQRPPVVYKKKEVIQEEMAEAILSPTSNPNRLKRIADLKNELNAAEKEVIANKLRSFEPTSEGGLTKYPTGLEKYGIIGLSKK